MNAAEPIGHTPMMAQYLLEERNERYDKSCAISYAEQRFRRWPRTRRRVRSLSSRTETTDPKKPVAVFWSNDRSTLSVRPRTGALVSTTQNDSITDVTEYFNWWVVDELTGASQLTTYKLSRANAQRAFPGAKPDVQTREVHDLTDSGRQAADEGTLAGTDPQMT